MDLIDATAGEVSTDSVGKISLSSLFRRTYSSITAVLDNMFRRSADKIPNNEEMRKEPNLEILQRKKREVTPILKIFKEHIAASLEKEKAVNWKVIKNALNKEVEKLNKRNEYKWVFVEG